MKYGPGLAATLQKIEEKFDYTPDELDKDIFEAVHDNLDSRSTRGRGRGRGGFRGGRGSNFRGGFRGNQSNFRGSWRGGFRGGMNAQSGRGQGPTKF